MKTVALIVVVLVVYSAKILKTVPYTLIKMDVTQADVKNSDS